MFEAWEKLGDFYFEDDRILIAEIDCEPALNKEVCKGLGVDAYPSLLLFRNGVKEEKYLEERGEADLIEYVDKVIKNIMVVKDET
jgi:Thioredoxin